MSQHFFKVGDVVILKGNSIPAMTVCGNENNEYAFCKWFDGENRLHSGSFHQDTLILVPQEVF